MEFESVKYYVAGGGYYMDSRGGYLHHKILPKRRSLFVDHKDGNKLNNNHSNLRYVTPSQNLVNTPSRTETGYKLVSFEPRCPTRPYKIQMRIGNKNYHFGRYETAEEAAYVADQVMLQIHGEIARTNFNWY